PEAPRRPAAPTPPQQRQPVQAEARPARQPAPEAPARGTITAERPAEAPMRQADASPQGGWVRDLLSNVAEDDTAPAVVAENAPRPTQSPRSPLQVVESLNSLSVDIARAIDHDASIELWDRYRRGERDVFTRRLYTLKGQQTFDEIRRKYQSDSEFRAAVDRYCEDFEKLLNDVARNDRDNVMTKTYLTSDTGKVYTMLAHAGGRLR
ncbi:MAG: hypothetical protein KKE32_19520, partial [Alphaproteobacteria bacterium]|nr:hypothetical protein [Alphaproteobacteria bacterium]MBU2313906.1 hypothetical protein [Alphaproteobacteria bacterium]